MFCEICGKRLTIPEIDKTEGIAWVCCPEYLEGNDEHDSFQVKLTQAVYEEFLNQQGQGERPEKPRRPGKYPGFRLTCKAGNKLNGGI